MNRVFGRVKKRSRAIFHVSLDPFPLEDDDRFGGLGMTVSGNDGAGGELAEEESGAVGGIVGKVGKLNSGVGPGSHMVVLGRRMVGNMGGLCDKGFALTILGVEIV